MATIRTATAARIVPEAKATVTATATETVKIRPEVRRKLLTELRAYGELKSQAKAIEHAMDAHKAKVRELRESTGASKIEIDGFKVCDVQGTSSKLDPKLLMERYDVTAAMITDCTVVTPKKSYEKISLPNEVEREY